MKFRLLLVIYLAFGALKSQLFAHEGHHHEPIPNFAASPTIRSVQNGSWSAASTWSPARSPNASDVVAITHAVTMDAASAISRVTSIESGGKLSFSTDRNTSLSVKELQVKRGGILQIATVESPLPRHLRAEIIFRDIAIDTASDPSQYGNGLLVEGEIYLYGAPLNRTFREFGQEPNNISAPRTLVMDGSVSDWVTGDELFIPMTDQGSLNPAAVPPKFESATVASVSGSTVTLQANLQFPHPSIRLPDGSIATFSDTGPLHGYAANLTRNIVLRSENPNGTRAHTMYTNGATIDMRFVRFENLGRTTMQPLNNTIYNASGGVVSVGTNQIGRYALHIHMLGLPRKLVNTEHGQRRFALIGNSVVAARKWAITVHDTHFGLIRDNVMKEAQGAGVYTETGFESNNIFERNFATRIFGTGGRSDERMGLQFPENGGFSGNGFWFSGPDNIVRDNVAMNTNSYCFEQYGYGGGNVPLTATSDETQAGQFRSMAGWRTRLREFKNNVCMSSPHGLNMWNVNAACCLSVNPSAEWSYFDGMVMAHVYGTPINGYGTNRVVFDRWRVVNDWQRLENEHESSGNGFADYLSPNTVIRNSHVIGLAIGFQVPTKIGDTGDGLNDTPRWAVIEDSFFQNRRNIELVTPFGVTGGGVNLPPRFTLVKNVKFAPLPHSVYQFSRLPISDLQYNFMGPGVNHNIMQSDQVYVLNYNQIPGNNFRYYFGQQSPSFVVPRTGSNERLGVGAPVEGLTNQQLWDSHRMAIAGSVARCSDRRDYIHGFSCPILADELSRIPLKLDDGSTPPSFPTPSPTIFIPPPPPPNSPTPTPTSTATATPTPTPTNTPRPKPPVAVIDFDGNGQSELALVDLSEKVARYAIQTNGKKWSYFNFGTSSDIHAPGDYDGDGRTDAAAISVGMKLDWSILNTATKKVLKRSIGKPGDTIIAGCDFDGDYLADPAVITRNGLELQMLSLKGRKLSKIKLPFRVRSSQKNTTCGPIDDVIGDELIVARRGSSLDSTALSMIHIYSVQPKRGVPLIEKEYPIKNIMGLLMAKLAEGTVDTGIVHRSTGGEYVLTFRGTASEVLDYNFPAFRRIVAFSNSTGSGFTLQTLKENLLLALDLKEQQPKVLSLPYKMESYLLLGPVTVTTTKKK